MHISPYEHGNIYNKDPLRTRKLLLNRREINKLTGLIKQKGLTLVPVSLYFNGNFLKIELGVGKGKKLYDKRQDIAKKDAERRMQQALSSKNKKVWLHRPSCFCVNYGLLTVFTKMPVPSSFTLKITNSMSRLIPCLWISCVKWLNQKPSPILMEE